MAIDGVRASVESTVDASGVPTVAIAGELDISNVSTVEAQLAPAVAGRTAVNFDLSSLTFMDSSGIAMLLRVREQTGGVVVAHSSRAVQRVIRATGLAEILGLPDD
jgi:anti-sigma B factor antagonist